MRQSCGGGVTRWPLGLCRPCHPSPTWGFGHEASHGLLPCAPAGSAYITSDGEIPVAGVRGRQARGLIMIRGWGQLHVTMYMYSSACALGGGRGTSPLVPSPSAPPPLAPRLLGGPLPKRPAVLVSGLDRLEEASCQQWVERPDSRALERRGLRDRLQLLGVLVFAQRRGLAAGDHLARRVFHPQPVHHVEHALEARPTQACGRGDSGRGRRRPLVSLRLRACELAPLPQVGWIAGLALEGVLGVWVEVGALLDLVEDAHIEVGEGHLAPLCPVVGARLGVRHRLRSQCPHQGSTARPVLQRGEGRNDALLLPAHLLRERLQHHGELVQQERVMPPVPQLGLQLER
mmetsp:Transcript_1056/g.2061  ORF Transcript_1056/g.2061 Transcript_1056/m.2061 type:complete len:346 (+) Transcript_1056:65-1102(+)